MDKLHIYTLPIEFKAMAVWLLFSVKNQTLYFPFDNCFPLHQFLPLSVAQCFISQISAVFLFANSESQLARLLNYYYTGDFQLHNWHQHTIQHHMIIYNSSNTFQSESRILMILMWYLVYEVVEKWRRIIFPRSRLWQKK